MAKIISLNSERAQRSASIILTRRKINSLKPRSARYQVSDATVTGLVVRVSTSGAKTFYAVGRVGKGSDAPRRFVKLGGCDALALIDARDQAQQLLADMRAGNDPSVTEPGSATLASRVLEYEKQLTARGVVKAADVIVSLQSNLKKYKDAPIGDLTRQQIVAEMERIKRSGRAGAAEYLRKNAMSFLNWAVNAGHLHANPMAGYRREKKTWAELIQRPRITFTTKAEIKSFWLATEATTTPVFRDLLRFLLLTGQRRTETSLMTWAHIDGETWTIPPAHAKTGIGHKVPLGHDSLDIIHSQPRYAGTNLVFVGRRNSQITGWTRLLEPVRLKLGHPTFAPHALRRTFRTGLEELGVTEAVAEMMIAHKRSDLVGRYSKAELWQRRLDAQATWETYVSKVVA